MSLSERFDHALAYAATAHRQQVRKGSGVPYVAHVLAVAALVIEFGGDEDEAIAALLHDAVEDQGGLTRLADIESRFGLRVAGIVSECSAEAKDGAGWRARKLRYLAALDSVSPSAVLVSVADKAHNARSILTDLRRAGPPVWDRFNAPEADQRWYYRELLGAYRRRAAGDDRIGPLVDDLAATVEAIWPPR